VNARGEFDSHFMTDFLAGKLKPAHTVDGLFGTPTPNSAFCIQHYLKTCLIRVENSGNTTTPQKDCNINASFYDIREYFQGRNEAGRMNSKSSDEMYNKLLSELRQAVRLLGEQIKPKIYEYGFLMS